MKKENSGNGKEEFIRVGTTLYNGSSLRTVFLLK